MQSGREISADSLLSDSHAYIRGACKEFKTKTFLTNALFIIDLWSIRALFKELHDLICGLLVNCIVMIACVNACACHSHLN